MLAGCDNEGTLANGKQRSQRMCLKALLVLCGINVIDQINYTILIPYADSMVTDFLGKPRGDPAAAIWVSVIVGSYTLCEFAFSYAWGTLSDRIGRRPVLLIGLVGSAVGMILFGISQSLMAAVAARVFGGFFCGNVGVTRTYLAESVDAASEAWAWSCLSTTFSAGMFIGQILGGLLVYPAQRVPSIFAGSVFETYPYLLPNFVVASLSLLMFGIGWFSLEETHKPLSAEMGKALLPAPPNAQMASSSSRLRAGLIALVLISGYTTARLQGFVLVVSLPRSMGGFALGPEEIGYMQMIAAAFILIAQCFIFSKSVERFGVHKCMIWGMGFTVLLTLPWPAYGLFADPHRFGLWTYAPLVLFQGVSQIGFSLSWPLIYLLINKHCTDQNRGAINGIANSVRALSGGLFPFAAGSLVTIGCQVEAAGFPYGRYLVFLVNLLPGLGFMALISNDAAMERRGQLVRP
eukprot:TRINITY_DN51606_c0_g1_i1.p1 TRINITY_DN51606_c0_g1~~TRINITY_DN51606_c0_g1_i1.p1  ORF type:complete len:480 (+),score=27.10 TRINITY_DN51606_c0_g1_i1:50-1441(+)